MAQRRMFSLKIVDTDSFLDMPISARLLYYDLSMRADDDGFVDSPKKILKIIGCSNDDLRILVAKQYLIPFESGVCVIKHWHIHNLIRSDRYSETEYLSEKSQLEKINNKYELTDGCQNRIPNGNQMATQVRIGKVNKNICSSNDERDCSFDSFWNAYPRKQAKKRAQTTWKTKNLERYLEERILPDLKFKCENCYPNGWLCNKTKKLLMQYIPLPASYLNAERWEDEIITEN